MPESDNMATEINSLNQENTALTARVQQLEAELMQMEKDRETERHRRIEAQSRLSQVEGAAQNLITLLSPNIHLLATLGQEGTQRLGDLQAALSDKIPTIWCKDCEYNVPSALYHGTCTKAQPNRVFTEGDRQSFFVRHARPDWCPLESRLVQE